MAYPQNTPDDPTELEGMQNDKPAATLENIVFFSDRFIEIDKELKEIDDYASKLEEEQRLIEEDTIPTIFHELTTTNLGLRDGFSCKIEPKFQGTVVIKDPAKAEKQLALLEKIGGEDIIKFDITCSFSKGKMKEAKILMDMLKEYGFEFKAKRSVHAGSLASFIKQKLELGQEVPLDEMGWRYFNRASIKKKGFKLRKRKVKREVSTEDEGDEE